MLQYGSWYFNTYPGCACDIPSNLYSYSFSLWGNQWNWMFARQSQIRDYLRCVADNYNLNQRTIYNYNVNKLIWDQSQQLWVISSTDNKKPTIYAKSVVNAMGGLADPKYIQFDGLSTFKGQLLHTAKWNHNVDLRNKNVVVIGTGASSVQLISEIQPLVKSLTVFQRTGLLHTSI